MSNYFFIRTNRQFVKINYNEVINIESAGNYVKIVTDGGIHFALVTILQLKRILPRDSFCKVNRGCIVSIDRIIAFDKDCVELKNKKIPFSDKCRKELEKRLPIITRD